MRIRYEPFGGLMRIDKPPATIYLDKNYMKSLGYSSSKLYTFDSTMSIYLPDRG